MTRLARFESNVPGLDLLLDGGLVAGASYIIQGRPGSGKTILANQIAFGHAARGGRVLFATMLAESHERLFQFLSTLDFFDRERIGAEVQFVSAFDTLETAGLDEVVKLLRREIQRQEASLLVVDGLLNARSRADTPLDTKKFIAELQGHAAFANCTVLFLTSARVDDGSPELTMVDGVIELCEEMVGVRSVRRLHLRKTRGSAAVSGLHEFEIVRGGLVVHPRLEAVMRPLLLKGAGMWTDAAASPPARLGSGIDDLDAMLGGGVPAGSSTLLMGPSGSGKTSVGLSFLAGCSAEAPGLLFGFFETPERLLRRAATLGYDLRALVVDGAVVLVRENAGEGLLDQLGHRLIDEVRRTGAKRVVIDSLGGMLRSVTNPARLVEFFSALVMALQQLGVTVLATWEMRDMFGTEILAPASEVASVVDNLVLLHFRQSESRLKRVAAIVKMRDSHYDPDFREVVFGDKIRLLPFTGQLVDTAP